MESNDLGLGFSLIPKPNVQGSIAIVMGFGVANRVLYKLALTPLSDYVFFLAQ